MSSSNGELGAFLNDLGRRRQRLVQLAGTVGDRQTLVEEVIELSEQLIVADEELRVQQDELEEARTRLVDLVAERQQLLGGTSQAWVVTDENGVVRQCSAAVERLILLPPGRVTPRPIATWFERADRSRVRSLIGAANAGRRAVQLDGVVLVRSDGSEVSVDLTATALVAEGGGREIRFEVSEPQAPAALRAVPEQATPGPDLLVAFAVATRALASRASRAEVAETAVELARSLVPGVQDAALAVREQQELRPAAASLPDLLELGRTRLQNWHVEPGSDQLDWSERGRHARSVRLSVGRRVYGVLTVFSATAASPDTVAVLDLVAAQVVTALARVTSEETLLQAVSSRQQIGEAVGVLVERHRLTSAEAFTLLGRQSQAENVKVIELARRIVHGGRDLGGLSA